MQTVIVRMFTPAEHPIPRLQGTVEVPGHQPQPFDDETALLGLLRATMTAPKTPPAASS